MQKRPFRWWEALVPLLMLALGLAPPAPLGHPQFALAGVLLSAAAAWMALAAWRLSGLPPFRARRKPGP